jgi:RNA polymerase sigma factor (sigma-70 family)
MDAPLSLLDPNAWSTAVEAANPASILVAIHHRMDPWLRECMSAEDIWQEALLRAWRHRRQFAWQGAPSFRRWLLSIAEHCLADQRDHIHAGKRNVARSRRLDATSSAEEQCSWTTPADIASATERADVMIQALAALPDGVREVVRLHLFEECTLAEIAACLRLGKSSVRRRFVRGMESYRRLLHGKLGRSGGKDTRFPPFGLARCDA